MCVNKNASAYGLGFRIVLHLRSGIVIGRFEKRGLRTVFVNIVF